MTIALVSLLLLVVLAFVYTIYRSVQIKENLKSNIYQVGHITDNLGVNHFKIVAKSKRDDKEFTVFEEFHVIIVELVEAPIIKLAKQSWNNKEEATLALHKLRVHAGQVPYQKNIKV